MSTTRRLAVAQIKRSPRRIFAIALAALLSAMAIMATGTFVGTLSKGMAASIAAPLSEGDAVVVNADDSLTADELRAVPGVTAAEPVLSSYARLQVNGANFDAEVHSLAKDEDLRWAKLDEGRWPTATNEVVTSKEHLERFQLNVGDDVKFELAPGSSFDATIVGTVTTGAPIGGLSWFIAPPEFLEEAGHRATEFVVAGDESPETLVASINDKLRLNADDKDGMHAITVQQHVDEQIADQTGSTQTLATVFIIFVIIAMLAAIMVIRNTFQVLLSQRLRENGLLRLVGATGGQVQRTVLIEAAIIGFVAALVGTVIGVGLGWLVASLARVTGGGIDISPWWALAAILSTTVMTVIAAWAPAARLRSLSPIASLGAAHTATAEREGRKLASWFIGGLLTAVGIVGVVLGAVRVFDPEPGMLVFILSGVLLAIGLFVLVPLLVRVIMPLLTAPMRAGGPVAKIARENLVRTARRSGTVVLAIAFGGSLVLAMLTAVSGTLATFNAQMDEDFAFDAVITTTDDSAIPSQVIDSLRDDKSVDTVELSAGVTLAGESEELPITELTTLPPSVAQSLKQPVAPGEVVVASFLLEDTNFKDGDTVTLPTADGGSQTLTVRSDEVMDSLGMFDPSGAMLGVVDAETLAKFGDPVENVRLWIQAPAEASNELAASIDRLRVDHPSLSLDGPLALQQVFVQVMTMMVTFVLAMLALTVVISGLGLASVIALAVGERRREIALLRALGTSRGAIRRMVFIESVVLALTGALFAIVIGIPLGMAALPALIPTGTIAFSIPWLSVLAVVLVALLIGVLAGASPARKATRIAPAQALAHQ